MRVMKTAKKMGIQTVAVYSDADRDSLFVQMVSRRSFRDPAGDRRRAIIIRGCFGGVGAKGLITTTSMLSYISKRDIDSNYSQNVIPLSLSTRCRHSH